MKFSLKDMQDGVAPLGIKEIVKLVDENPDYSNDDINNLISLEYDVQVEDLCIDLARVKF